LRIGHFVSHFPESGGTTNAMLGLSAGLVRMGHEVVVYRGGPPRHRIEGEESLRKAATARIEVPDIGAGRGDVVRPQRRRLLSALSSNRDRLDVLVIHSVFGLLHPSIERACRRGGIGCIACPHDPYSPELFGQRKVLKTLYWHALEAPFLRKTRAIHVLAPSHAGYLHDRGIDVPIFAVPNGLSREQLEYVHRAPLRDRPGPHDLDTLRLLFFGRWDVFNKGLDLLLEAISADRTLRPRVHLQIAGRGSEANRRALRRLIDRLGLETQVSLVGFLPDVRAAIWATDFVVMPSRFDGFAQTIIEALALETPVIVSSKAGSSEYFGREQGALITDPNVPDLVRTLRVAIESRGELRTAAQVGRSRLVDEFNWDAIAAKWVSAAQASGALPSTA
jgi:glycosyltransferase involved in cell wall biosynthesis